MTWNRFRNWGRDQAQGYYLARPMPGQVLTGWLSSRLNLTAPVL